MSKWTLFSNHGHVLVVLSRDPDARLRDVAQIVGITERAVQKIVRDLQDGGLVSVTKQGRRNRYRLHPNQPLRHTLEAHCTTGELLEMINRRAPGVAVEEPEPTPTPALETGLGGVFETGGQTEAPAPSPDEGPLDFGVVAETAEPTEQTSRPRSTAVEKPEPVEDDNDQGSLF